MKKLLLGIFICFSFIFVMSHNANALNFTMDLDSYDQAYYSGAISTEFSYDINGSSLTTINSCTICSPGSAGIINIRSLKPLVPVINYKKNDVITFDLLIWTKKNYSVDNIIKIINIFPDNNNFNYLGYENVTYEFSPEILSYYTVNANDQLNNIRISSKNQGYVVARLYFRVKNDTNAALKLSSSNFIFEYMSIEDEINFRLANYFVYRYAPSKEDEVAQKELESTDNIENQTPPNQSQTGDGAQATNLIGAFSGFVSALGGLSATNCNLTLNFPDFAGGSRVVNVCQNKDKAGNIISVFSSLTLIIFYVPLAIRLLTMIYNEIRSFTNG